MVFYRKGEEVHLDSEGAIDKVILEVDDDEGDVQVTEGLDQSSLHPLELIV